MVGKQLRIVRLYTEIQKNFTDNALSVLKREGWVFHSYGFKKQVENIRKFLNLARTSFLVIQLNIGVPIQTKKRARTGPISASNRPIHV
jgi:hypothetical protein